MWISWFWLSKKEFASVGVSGYDMDRIFDLLSFLIGVRFSDKWWSKSFVANQDVNSKEHNSMDGES
jgi:hypothetical protein